MRKLFVPIAVVVLTLATAGIASADSAGPMSPAPNQGDGVSDGSGFDQESQPIGNTENGTGPRGPAPNSGDGVPDGSGF